MFIQLPGVNMKYDLRFFASVFFACVGILLAVFLIMSLLQGCQFLTSPKVVKEGAEFVDAVVEEIAEDEKL